MSTPSLSVPVGLYRVKYSLNDTQEELLVEERGRGGLFPPPLPLDAKAVAHLILGAEPPRLPACLFHKLPMLIDLFLAYHFISR